MNSPTSLTVRGKEAQAARSRAGNTLSPYVDIFEDANGVTLIADVPGVSKEGLDIRVESDRLFISAEARIAAPEGLQLHHVEMRDPVYERTFGLSREMDTSRIDATLKDGVLTVKIPKSEQSKPRKIEIRSA